MQSDKTVLVLDDDDDVRHGVADSLTSAGFEVLTARAPEQALRLLHRHDVDVMLVDIVMEGAPSGLDLITSVRRDFTTDCPRIIASASFAGFAEEALERGAWTFLPKPVTPDDLQNAVEAALQDEQPTEDMVRAVAARAWQFRSRAAAHAEAAFRDLDARHPTFRERALRCARWASNYLGVEHVLVAGLSGGSLRVEVANDTGTFPVGESLNGRLLLCRDIVETSARLLLPDVAACPWLAARLRNVPVRSFAAVPLLAGNGLAFGVLCAFDARPSRLTADDLAHLEHLGRRTSAVVLDVGSAVSSRFFDSENVLCPDSFAEVFGTELRRVRNAGGAIELAMLSLTRQYRDGAWLEATTRLSNNGARRALGAFGQRKLGFYLVGRDAKTVTTELRAALKEARELLGAFKVGVVSAGGAELPSFNEQELLRLAHALADRALPGDAGSRLVVRSEPLG